MDLVNREAFMEVRGYILKWNCLEEHTPLLQLGLEGRLVVIDTHEPTEIRIRMILCRSLYYP